MSIRYRQRILDHLAHDNYRPSVPSAVARDLRIDPDDRDDFNASVKSLIHDGLLELGADDLLRLPHFPDELEGRLRLNRRGFGFVIPDHPFRDGDLFIPIGETSDAISGDRVRAQVFQSSSKRQRGRPDRRYYGKVVEVLNRGRDNFAGVLVKRRGAWFVVPDGTMLQDHVLIRDPHAKNAKEGDKVVIELVHYPDVDALAEGVITRVLGEAGRPDVETEAVIAAHGLRTEFSEAVLDEARASTRSFDEMEEGPWPDREDLTGQFIFTIDPPDAKDFDDAISLSYDEAEKEWTLGVHIADVSTFVGHQTALDEEAEARGNSVYLPRLVIPMLPEQLSNGVCSLQEGVNRFTKSAFITFDAKGRVMAQRVSNTVIRSVKRLTYLEAQALIDGDQKEARKHARTEPVYTDQLIDTLRQADTLAKVLRQRRLRDGMIVLNLPEVELIFDDDGHVIDAVPEDDAFTHTIIEMFMVEANEALARLFSDLDVPILRRVHPDPVHGDTEDLEMYARAAKQHVPEAPTRKDLQRLLDATRGTPAARAIHFAVLKTLTKAEYSPALIGHYALASDHYAHFTSPIRRYPDLTLHRALQAYLEKTENGTKATGGRRRKSLANKLMDDSRVLFEDELIRLGRHCSQMEVEAAAAERELRDFLVMQFLKEHHLGDTFPGVVTGVSRGGVWVSIEKYLVEGMVPVENLPTSKGRQDFWRISEQTGRLFSKRSNASIGVGDIVNVQIAAIDLPSRQMDLLIETLPERVEVDDQPTGGRTRGRADRQKKDRKGGKGGKRRSGGRKRRGR